MAPTSVAVLAVQAVLEGFAPVSQIPWLSV